MTKNTTINDYQINWQSGELFYNGEITQLEPKLVQVLKVLVDANGELVTYDQLQQKVWPDVVVAPNALQRIITQLRRHLGDSAKQQKVIRTHPKRGYSLVAPCMEHASVEEPTNKVSRKLAFSIALISTLILLALVLSMSGSINEGKKTKNAVFIKQIRSIDTQSNKISNVLAYQDNEFVFTEEVAGKLNLVRLDEKNNTKHVLLSDLWLHGAINHAPNGGLYLSKTRFNNGIKCAEIINFKVNTGIQNTLFPCQNNFNHSAMQYDENSILFLKTNKNRQSQLFHLDLRDNKQTLIDNAQIAQFKVNFHSQDIAVRIDRHIYIGNVTADKLNLNSPRLTLEDNDAVSMFWLNNNTLMVAHKKQLFWLKEDLTNDTTTLATPRNASQITSKDNRLFTLLTQQNWQPRKTNFASLSPFIAVTQSKFSDKNSQFRPNSDDISFLSDRSGTTQVWLVTGENNNQLTQSENDITSYIWTNRDELFYLANNQLWRLNLSGENHSIQLNYDVHSIMQYYGDSLLLKVQKNNRSEAFIIEYHLTQQTAETVLEHDAHWVQRFDENILLYNIDGRLKKKVDGQPSTITALPSFILQWRYFVKDGYVYLQDKQQNVWRYNALHEKAEVVGKYDINNLFMTDFKPQSNTMLSDNYISEHAELVEIYYSNQQ